MEYGMDADDSKLLKLGGIICGEKVLRRTNKINTKYNTNSQNMLIIS